MKYIPQRITLFCLIFIFLADNSFCYYEVSEEYLRTDCKPRNVVELDPKYLEHLDEMGKKDESLQNGTNTCYMFNAYYMFQYLENVINHSKFETKGLKPPPSERYSLMDAWGESCGKKFSDFGFNYATLQNLRKKALNLHSSIDSNIKLIFDTNQLLKNFDFGASNACLKVNSEFSELLSGPRFDKLMKEDRSTAFHRLLFPKDDLSELKNLPLYNISVTELSANEVSDFKTRNPSQTGGDWLDQKVRSFLSSKNNYLNQPMPFGFGFCAIVNGSKCDGAHNVTTVGVRELCCGSASKCTKEMKIFDSASLHGRNVVWVNLDEMAGRIEKLGGDFALIHPIATPDEFVPEIQGKSPLYYLTVARDIDTLRSVLPKYQKDINEPLSSYGATPLYAASAMGFVDVVQILVENGADIHKKSRMGNEPLATAAYRNNIEVVQYLLEHGATVSSEDLEGKTALHFAAEGGNGEIVKILLAHSANPLHKNTAGETPLDVATKKGFGDLIPLLSAQ